MSEVESSSPLQYAIILGELKVGKLAPCDVIGPFPDQRAAEQFLGHELIARGVTGGCCTVPIMSSDEARRQAIEAESLQEGSPFAYILHRIDSNAYAADELRFLGEVLRTYGLRHSRKLSDVWDRHAELDEAARYRETLSEFVKEI